MRTWHTIADLIEHYAICAMVTVVEVKGSAPREAGARLFVVEGGGYRGTIGGGALEWQALAQAQEALSRWAPPQFVRAVLGPDLGQCCGGQVKLLIENFSADDLPMVRELAAREAAGPFTTSTVLIEGRVRRTMQSERSGHPGVRIVAEDALIEAFGDAHRAVFLFGAGHIGRALVLALAPLPFAVTWIDSRREAFPGAVPANVSVVLSGDPAATAERAPAGALVLIMTHSHALDLAITARALALSRIPYVGVIGSDTKRARFTARLRSAGFEESALRRFFCPIGMGGIRSKIPAAIAASTAADLLARDEMLRASAGSLTLVHKIA
ncbi:MAG: xanthine dehydrogenase accessory protein XdhC [Pseudomonadota bacterium]|nr:xanthine dehydrogenase accessory protein XdhC [Pseudomonadota bacterium]